MSAVHRGRVAGVLAMVLLGAASSQAAPVPVPCAFNTAMTVNDMTFGSPATAATAATACAWSTDNQAHKLKEINSQWQNWSNPPGTPGVAFVELAKWDTGNRGTLTSRSAFGFDWALALIPAAKYSLTATPISPAPADAVTLPHIFDFVGVLKGGSGAGSWFFDDRLFNSPGGGTWQINFTNNGNNIPDLSHLSIFGRSVGAPPPPPPPPNGVPSPGTLPLVGLALLAGWVAARRRS